MDKHRNCRTGISLFEVLISILVAAIGVLGVLVLVPFAAKNAQIGIDRESSINAAKNFNADFQAYGYHDPATWYDDVPDQQNGVAPSTTNSGNICPEWIYIIDPVGAYTNANVNASLTSKFGQFPLPTAFADLPRFNIASIGDSTGFFVNPPLPAPPILIPAMDLARARQLAMQPDDLKFDDPATELGPPRQLYYSVGNNNQAKRQYDGRYSTISFAIPEDAQGEQYRMYTLVGKAGDRSSERVFQLPLPANGGGPRAFEEILLGGGDVLLTEAPQTVPARNPEIRNNDYIILVNYDPASGAPLYDDVQINFYRVIHAAATGNANEYSVTLQGPDFDAFPDWNTSAAAGSQAPSVVTYAILIPNVLAVYERTFRVEPDSTWQSN